MSRAILPISQNGVLLLNRQTGYLSMHLGLIQFIEHQEKGSPLIRSSHEQAKPIDHRNY